MSNTEFRTFGNPFTVTPRGGGGGGGVFAQDVPWFSTWPAAKTQHFLNTWEGHADIDDLGTELPEVGGQAWTPNHSPAQGQPLGAFRTLVDTPDPFGSDKFLTLDYDKTPPIAAHGTGAHAQGPHWSGAYTGSFQGDANSALNRGIDMNGGFVSSQRMSVVLALAHRYRAAPIRTGESPLSDGTGSPYEGKAYDINSGIGSGVGRWNYECFGANYGVGRTFQCDELMCENAYTDDGDVAIIAGWPDVHNRYRPQFTRSQTNGELTAATAAAGYGPGGAGNALISYGQNRKFGPNEGEYTWGSPNNSWGTNVGDPNTPNADGLGNGTRVCDAGWLLTIIRLTRENASGFVYGRGRCEVWIGTALDKMVKIIEFYGDESGGFHEGEVWMVPTAGTSDFIFNFHCHSLTATVYRGGCLVDLGYSEVWSHEPVSIPGGDW